MLWAAPTGVLQSLLCAGLCPCCGGFRHPARTVFSSTRTDTETPNGSQNSHKQITKLQSAPHYNHKYKHTIMRTIKPHNCNVNVSTYKNPRTQPYSIQTMQWHDRWRPHASQWPKPAYQPRTLCCKGFSFYGVARYFAAFERKEKDIILVKSYRTTAYTVRFTLGCQ